MSIARTLILTIVLTLGIGLTPAQSAARRVIIVENNSVAFYISFRCYDRHYKGVGPWHTNLSVVTSDECSGEPSYVRINRKNLFFRNFGSTWRIWFADNCPGDRHMCVTINGGSASRSSYKVHCARCGF